MCMVHEQITCEVYLSTVFVVCVWCVWWCVVQMIHRTACLSRRVLTMHLIGWQNTWEQAPGVPATPSPP